MRDRGRGATHCHLCDPDRSPSGTFFSASHLRDHQRHLAVGRLMQRRLIDEIHQNRINANTPGIVIKGDGIHRVVVIGVNFLVPNLRSAIVTRKEYQPVLSCGESVISSACRQLVSECSAMACSALKTKLSRPAPPIRMSRPISP